MTACFRDQQISTDFMMRVNRQEKSFIGIDSGLNRMCDLACNRGNA